jgi:hypothetical protein
MDHHFFGYRLFQLEAAATKSRGYGETIILISDKAVVSLRDKSRTSQKVVWCKGKSISF